MRLQNNYNYQEFGSGLISSDFKKEGKIKNYSSIISKNLNSKEQEYKLWKLRFQFLCRYYSCYRGIKNTIIITCW